MKRIILKRCVATILAFVLLASLSACCIVEEENPNKEMPDITQNNKEVAEETFSLNETAVFNTLKITATDIQESKGESFFAPASGNVFVGVKFTIENISDEDQAVSSLLLFDAYADDVACDLSITASAAFDGITVDGTIKPGKKLVGWYAMEIPKDWKTLELNVKANWLTSSSAKFIFTK